MKWQRYIMRGFLRQKGAKRSVDADKLEIIARKNKLSVREGQQHQQSFSSQIYAVE